MGCPLVRKFILRNMKLPTLGINYLINNFTQLEVLKLTCCNICDDGLIITKNCGKLKHLKYLDLSYNYKYITDESFINIIKGCHNLEKIFIDGCSELTDISLFSIAANCHILKEIDCSTYKSKFTNIEITALKNKCLPIEL